MPDAETIWDAEPHTLAKHRILAEYLKGWIPILSHQSAKVPAASGVIRYVDGFAGPGIYKGGEPGSPLLALEGVIEHGHELPTPVELSFIELDEDRHESLCAEIEKRRTEIDSSPKVAAVHTHCGDCKKLIPSLIQPHNSGGGFGPAIFFLDQFGYTEVPISLLQEILAMPVCEVFSFLNWDHLNRFITDPSKADGLTSAFGSEDWRECVELPPERRASVFLDSYKAALQNKGGAKYVLHFAMHDKHDKLLNWLFFCTNSLRGLEVMKRAMRKVDEGGTFRFSDRDSTGQMTLLANLTDLWLSNELAKRLSGRSMTVNEVKEFVLVETPSQKFKEALKILEKANLLHVPNAPMKRKTGSFGNENMVILFAPDPSKPKPLTDPPQTQRSLFDR